MNLESIQQKIASLVAVGVPSDKAPIVAMYETFNTQFTSKGYVADEIAKLHQKISLEIADSYLKTSAIEAKITDSLKGHVTFKELDTIIYKKLAFYSAVIAIIIPAVLYCWHNFL